MTDKDQNNRDEVEDKLKGLILDIDASRDITSDDDLKKIADEYIDALEDTTRFTDSKLDVIASEVIEDFERNALNTLKQQHARREFIRKLKIAILSVIVIAGVLTIFYQFDPLPGTIKNKLAFKPSVNTVETSKTENHSTSLDSALGEVLIQLSPAKRHVIDFYMANNDLPDTGDIPVETISALETQEWINGIYLSEQGRLNVSLSGEFGERKILFIEPVISNNGSNISWRCESNVTLINTDPGDKVNCQYNAELIDLSTKALIE